MNKPQVMGGNVRVGVSYTPSLSIAIYMYNSSWQAAVLLTSFPRTYTLALSKNGRVRAPKGRYSQTDREKTLTLKSESAAAGGQ